MSDPINAQSEQILGKLKLQYPNKKCYDLDGRGLHFVCEIEPAEDHPEYDLAIEIIIESKPHKHNKMTQTYTVLSGILELHAADKVIVLEVGESYTIKPHTIHWAKSNDEAEVKVYSQPGWTKEDHIPIDR